MTQARTLSALSALLAGACTPFADLESLQGSGPADAATEAPEHPADGATPTDGAWGCTPKSCAEQNADCGSVPDGCNTTLECGTCGPGRTCGAAGPNRCGTGTCTPLTCTDVGAECGLVSDGCGNTVDCGGCSAPEVCTGGGVANQCGCMPKTCSELGAECGSVSDGCGGALACGNCSSGETCANNQCACAPKSCAQLGAQCGSIGDGCGGTVQCGSCPAPQTCGGGSVANQCALLENWKPCDWNPIVCQSGVCGCNGAAPPTVCLPAGYPTHCSSGAPNWWSCFEDFECQSGWCGCNYDPWPPKCLPNTSYPKTCL